jgi:adenylate kinase
MSNLVDKKTLDSFAEYADKHGIYDKFHYLVSRLLLAKPADPFQFMIETLQKPSSKIHFFYL